MQSCACGVKGRATVDGFPTHLYRAQQQRNITVSFMCMGQMTSELGFSACTQFLDASSSVYRNDGVSLIGKPFMPRIKICICIWSAALIAALMLRVTSRTHCLLCHHACKDLTKYKPITAADIPFLPSATRQCNITPQLCPPQSHR